MLCIFRCSRQRNVVSYLLIFCIPIRSPSIQYTSHFYLLWKVGIWAIESLNFKNHSLVIRNRIHHISRENSLPPLSMIRVCSQFIIFGFFFFPPLCHTFSFLMFRVIYHTSRRREQETASSTNCHSHEVCDAIETASSFWLAILSSLKRRYKPSLTFQYIMKSCHSVNLKKTCHFNPSPQKNRFNHQDSMSVFYMNIYIYFNMNHF